MNKDVVAKILKLTLVLKMQVPNFIKMLDNRCNLIFRGSIVFNIAVFLCAAVRYSGNSPKGVQWVPITSDGSERAAELRYLKEFTGYDTLLKMVEPSARVFGKFTPQKVISSKISTVKQKDKIPSIASDVEKKMSAVQSEAKTINRTLDPYDDRLLSKSTLMLLRALLACNDKDYRPKTMQHGEFFVLKNYVRANHGAIGCHETITYTTHGSFEFLNNLIPLIKRWMAPVSLSLYAPGSDMTPTVDSIRYLRDCTDNDLVLQYVTFHIFFPHKHIPRRIPDPLEFLMTPYHCTGTPPYLIKSLRKYKQIRNFYPINVARNIARSAALTHFILQSDMELYPSQDLVPKFLNMIARNEEPLSTSTNSRVFPLSVFEVREKSMVPWSKTELQAMLKNGTAIPFHKHGCPLCHDAPHGEEWMAAPEEKYMRVFHVGKRMGKHLYWEPIFIETNAESYYDERLSYEGRQDRITQGYILCVKNYDFMILNNAFVVHKPGIKYYRKNSKSEYIISKQFLYVKNVILPELKKLFGDKDECML